MDGPLAAHVVHARQPSSYRTRAYQARREARPATSKRDGPRKQHPGGAGSLVVWSTSSSLFPSTSAFLYVWLQNSGYGGRAKSHGGGCRVGGWGATDFLARPRSRLVANPRHPYSRTNHRHQGSQSITTTPMDTSSTPPCPPSRESLNRFPLLPLSLRAMTLARSPTTWTRTRLRRTTRTTT